MKKSTYFLSIVLILIACSAFSQEYYDIKNPGKDYYKKCDECISLLNSKPNEIQFGIQRDNENNLYFVVSHKEWFYELFKKSTDGIAIDIVSKERYDCSKQKLDDKSAFKGDLQKPIYLKEMKSKMLPSQNEAVAIKIGKIPYKYINKEVEFNLVILKNKYLCHYNNFYDLKTYRWDLLDMGMYMDTLTYKTKNDDKLTEQEKFILQNKILRFEIPFEKNKSEYSHEDIKPLYDSLRLTDFNIKKITIKAYSSIEGNAERNIELQQSRANSIAKALQNFQEPTIENEIIVSENWVEFLNDITTSSYSNLLDLSKEEIKERLKDKKLAANLEPYLQKHRKAIVLLELQKKDRYKDMSPSGLMELFTKSISDKNLEQAIEIQNSIFEKIENQEIPVNFINNLEIPQQTEFGTLLNKKSMFKYLMNETDVYSTFLELQNLEDLLPKDGHVKYNICALKFKVWLLGEQAVIPEDFKKEINALSRYGIPYNLVKRMLVNYNIVMSEYYMSKGDFANKDKSLRFIFSNYESIPLGDFDYLSLAQYFSSYAKYDWAIKLLNKKVKNIEVDEDLLFYYLNLTLIDEKLTKTQEYRTIMLNAINVNKERFCKLFSTYGKGGVTFQLLENEYLRKTNCENCNN